MGNLTTFTIYNDGLHLLEDEKNAIEFAKKIVEHAKSHTVASDISLGSFANFCRAQETRHADDSTIYVHAGNTVIDVNPYQSGSFYPKSSAKIIDFGDLTPEMNRLYARNKNFFKKILRLLVNDTNALINIVEEEEIKQLILEDSGVLPKKKLSDKIHQELLLESFKNKDNETLVNYIKLFN